MLQGWGEWGRLGRWYECGRGTAGRGDGAAWQRGSSEGHPGAAERRGLPCSRLGPSLHKSVLTIDLCQAALSLYTHLNTGDTSPHHYHLISNLSLLFYCCLTFLSVSQYFFCSLVWLLKIFIFLLMTLKTEDILELSLSDVPTDFLSQWSFKLVLSTHFIIIIVRIIVS